MTQIELTVENSSDAIIGKNLDGKITSWNGGATKMFGYTAEEAIGRSILFLFPSELKAELPKLLDKIKADEFVSDYNTMRVKKDGSKINVALSISPIKKDGKIIGASIVERNITTRNEEEESMRQIQLIMDNSYDAIIGETLDGTVTSWNGGAARMFGYTSNEVIGKSVTFLLPPNIKHEVAELLDKVKNGETIADYDSVRVKKDGSMINISLSISPVKDEVNTIIGASVVERDITKRKIEEEKMRQIQLIVEHSHDAIIGETPDGTVTSWNGGAIIMFGYSKEEMIGKSLVNLFPSELKDELPKLLEKVSRGEIIADYDSVWIRKDMARADVEFSLSPIVGEDGKIIGTSLVGRDITRRKSDESHIKELNDVRSKFIDIIAHQLRTPLGAVNWNLEVLLNGDFGKLTEAQYKFLQVTHKSSLEITNRLHDLLTAIDIEEDRIVYDKGEVDLANIAGVVVNGILERCNLKNVSCSYIPPTKELPLVMGDNEKIRTVISNIMENSLMYTKESGKIIAKLEAAGESIRFEVTDTGVGIPTPEQHRVFTRFFRASNASIMEPDAFGLGLFIAKSFITQHGGTIGFQSLEGKGSTFWFEIPMRNQTKFSTK